MADQIKIGIAVDADARSAEDLGRTLDDVAAAGESVGEQIEESLRKGENATRPTNSEFRRLAADLKGYASAMGKDLSEAFADFERHAQDAGLEVSDGTMDALRRLSQQGPSDVDLVRDAFRELRADAKGTGEGLRDDVVDGIEGIRHHLESNPPITAGDLLRAELRAEVLQNFTEVGAEVVRGFKDGFSSEDLDTIVDGVTDTIMSLGMVTGPIGQAGAFMASTLIQTFYGAWQGNSEQVAAIGAEVRDILVENSTGAFEHLSEEARTAFQEVRADALLTQYGVEEIEGAAATLGVTAGEVLAAMAGDTEAATLVQDAYRRKIDETRETHKTSGEDMALAMGMVDESVKVVTDEMGNLREGVSQAEREYDVLQGASSEFRRGAQSDASAASGAMRDFGLTADDAARYRQAKTDAVLSGADNVAERLNEIARRRAVVYDVQLNGDATVEARLRNLRQLADIPVTSRRVGGPTP